MALASRRRGTVVIGQEMAEAAANERARLEAGPVAPSPLPAERYDVERGDYSFLSVKPLALDLQLQTMTRRFAHAGPQERHDLTASISMDDQYTLLHFASRCAVLALRESASSWCEDGLFALAMIDETRIDWRDAVKPAGLLSYAMAATGTTRNELVDRAKALARTGMKDAIESARTPRTLADCLYVRVDTEDGGFGLVEKGLKHYEPTLGMTRLALQLANWLEKGGRYIATPRVAEELPSVWFAKEHRPAAEQVLARARAGITIGGKVHKAPPFAHLFIAWVLELPSERDAALLSRYVGSGTQHDARFVAGTARGPLFAILVAGSLQQGVAPLESRESLVRLLDDAAPLLEEAVARR